MIKIENVDTYGWEAAVRGMRNPMNSWDKSDSYAWRTSPRFTVGDNDLKLMQSLAKAGDDHAKFLRMINVTADITAPRYWWPEFDTYKVGTVANSCSTMHKLADKEFTVDDFSCEYLIKIAYEHLQKTIKILNGYRSIYLDTKEKEIWWQMIQLLPQSYNQKRTVQLNYQVLAHMYFARKNHKLDEWHEFCAWVEGLPYFKEIVIQGGET